MQKIYKPAQGARLSVQDAQIYGEHIDNLTQKTGYVTPLVILKDAKDKKSPLHVFFDWDDTEAAHKWRIEQAKYLLRHITVEIINDGETQTIRHFHSVVVQGKIDEPPCNVYVTTDTILTDKDKRAQVVAHALRELKGWMQRYEQYYQFCRGYTSCIHV